MARSAWLLVALMATGLATSGLAATDTCAYLYTRGDNSGDNWKIKIGDEESGIGSTGGVRNWILFEETRTQSVKVKKGCTLQGFSKKGFENKLGEISGPGAEQFQQWNQVMGADFTWAGNLRSWKCHC